jgi:regulatory protein SWI5
METPHDRFAKQDERPNRFSDDYDGSMEETIKPNRNRSQQNMQNMFQDMRQQAQPGAAAPSPPSSTPMTHSKTFSNVSQDFMNMNSFRNEFIKMEGGFANQPQEHDFLSEQDLSQHTTPDTHNLDAFGGEFDQIRADLQPFEALRQAENADRRSFHRRTESVASMASAASIASINIEETKTETGVTVEEIAQFIQSPETTDGKWTCLFEDCGKQFGRKENIKSHVQTHLNDRQYQCPNCKKCFVRQHDLKRHAKIHTGIKPYPCECGNSFARHDALTRHRQRGMCIGAFDGIVRKVVKRGRPKKSRPDMETRMEKSSRQRKKNMSISSMSSLSGYSDSSAVNSPDADFNMLDDVMDMGPIDSHMQKVASLSSAPMPNMVRRSEEASVSPYAASVQSYVSPEAIMDKAPSAESPAKSAMSHYNTPPELSQSSSPPPVRLFPADPSNSMGADDLTGLSAVNNLTDVSGMNNTLPMGADQQNDDIMLQFTNDDGLVQLERDPSMLMMSKFDEEFNMFTNNDDMFFGSS